MKFGPFQAVELRVQTYRNSYAMHIFSSCLILSRAACELFMNYSPLFESDLHSKIYHLPFSTKQGA